MIWIILLLLLGAAILYGIFFLFFKLVWVLFKKQRNFWPLILAGAATLLTVGGLIFSIIYTGNKLLKPLLPIVDTIQTRTEPVYGSQLYVDPTYGFSIMLYDGTVLSDWINWKGTSVLVGLDTNIKFAQQQDPDDIPLTFLLIGRQPKVEQDLDAYNLLKGYIQQAKNSDADAQVVFSDISPAFAGADCSAAIVRGTIQNPTTSTLHFTLLLCKRGSEMYFVVGCTSSADTTAIDFMTNSFRLQNPVSQQNQ